MFFRPDAMPRGDKDFCFAAPAWNCPEIIGFCERDRNRSRRSAMGTYRGRSSEDRQPQDEDEYTTTGLESEWYGHPGPATPSDRERMRKHHAIEDDGRPPFEAGHDGKTAIPPDRHLDD